MDLVAVPCLQRLGALWRDFLGWQHSNNNHRGAAPSSSSSSSSSSESSSSSLLAADGAGRFEGYSFSMDGARGGFADAIGAVARHADGVRRILEANEEEEAAAAVVVVVLLLLVVVVVVVR